jgi:hypothetical protein
MMEREGERGRRRQELRDEGGRGEGEVRLERGRQSS